MKEGTVWVEVERDQDDMSAPGTAGLKSRRDASEKMSLWRAIENWQRLRRIGKAHGKLNKKLQGKKKNFCKKKKKGVVLQLSW